MSPWWRLDAEWVNRYRRRLETCPQAKTSKSWHANFFSFSDASERRVWLSTAVHRVENTRVHFWTFSPVSSYFENRGGRLSPPMSKLVKSAFCARKLFPNQTYESKIKYYQKVFLMHYFFENIKDGEIKTFCCEYFRNLWLPVFDIHNISKSKISFS